MELLVGLIHQPWWYWIVAVGVAVSVFVLCAIAITLANLSPKSINENNNAQTLYIVAGFFSIACGIFWQTFLMAVILISLVCSVMIIFNKDK